MGIELNNNYLYTLQFASDQAVITNDKEDIKYMMGKLIIEEYERWRLSVKVPKTKYLCLWATTSHLDIDNT